MDVVLQDIQVQSFNSSRMPIQAVWGCTAFWTCLRILTCKHVELNESSWGLLEAESLCNLTFSAESWPRTNRMTTRTTHGLNLAYVYANMVLFFLQPPHHVSILCKYACVSLVGFRKSVETHWTLHPKGFQSHKAGMWVRTGRIPLDPRPPAGCVTTGCSVSAPPSSTRSQHIQ